MQKDRTGCCATISEEVFCGVCTSNIQEIGFCTVAYYPCTLNCYICTVRRKAFHRMVKKKQGKNDSRLVFKKGWQHFRMMSRQVRDTKMVWHHTGTWKCQILTPINSIGSALYVVYSQTCFSNLILFLVYAIAVSIIANIPPSSHFLHLSTLSFIHGIKTFIFNEYKDKNTVTPSIWFNI